MKRLLVKALKNTFDMDKKDAEELTKTIEGIFDGKKEIKDEEINKYARALFYDLQRKKLLKTRREEFKKEGKYIRKYYWALNNETIRKLAHKKSKEKKYEIYEKIPTEAWVTHSYAT